MSTPHELYLNLTANLKVTKDNAIVNALLDVCKFGELSISGLSVTTETCNILSQILTQSKDIVKLSASDCLLPPQGLATMLSIMHMTSLHTLQLRGNNIAGPSVSKLSKMLSRSVNIKNLGLEWNSLGLCSEGMTQFCNALAVNHTLEVLDLRNNQLDEGCAALLAAAVRKNTSLRVLDLRWNSLEQSGGQCFLTALQSNKTLTVLKLQGNSIFNELLTAIDQCVKHNMKLLQLESRYEARKELLANYVQSVNSQRAQELRDWADKSQQQVSEMDKKVKEMQELLSSKHKQIEELEGVVSKNYLDIEAFQNQVRSLQQDMKTQNDSHAAVVRDYRLQLEICNKALAANKSGLYELERKLNDERNLKEKVEKDRDKYKEKLLELENEIEKEKEKLQTTITEHIAAVEHERNLSQQRLALATEEWNERMRQSAAVHSRAEEVYRDKVRALETALEAAEQSRVELSTKWAVERAKWAEEKATILVEVKEKEACKVLLLTEKIEHLKEENVRLETQLGAANMLSQQQQRDNAIVLADLGDLRRRLSSVQEELSNEKLLTQKLRSEKAEDVQVLENIKGELKCAQRSVIEANDRHEELQREIRRLTGQLEDKERVMTVIRKEEKDRAGMLIAAIKNYVDQVNYNS